MIECSWVYARYTNAREVIATEWDGRMISNRREDGNGCKDFTLVLYTQRKGLGGVG